MKPAVGQREVWEHSEEAVIVHGFFRTISGGGGVEERMGDSQQDPMTPVVVSENRLPDPVSHLGSLPGHCCPILSR